MRFSGIDLKNFKKFIPEFSRNDRGFYDDYWSDVFSSVSSLIIKIVKELSLYEMPGVMIVSLPSPKNVGLPLIPGMRRL